MNEGALKKKTKNKLTFEHIKESFLKKVPECGIVAMFIRYKTKGMSSADCEYVFEYLNQEEFSISR